MPSGWTGGQVSFIIDYVVSSAATGPTGPTAPADHLTFSNYVYDPFSNTVPTTAGFSDYAWTEYGPSSVVNDGKFPVARSEAISIDCGEGH